MTQVHLVDLNPVIVAAWKTVFKDEPNVTCSQGDITKEETDVWVTSTNSKGRMNGGVDFAIKNALGSYIEDDIQEIIDVLHNGHLPVGKAVIVPVKNGPTPKHVVATPSMVGESDNLERTKNTALACAAAFQALYYAEDKHGAVINSVSIPGLGSGTGRVPPFLCAQLMYIGYTLFRRKRYDSFDEMLTHLNTELENIGQLGASKAGPQPIEPPVQSGHLIDNLHDQAHQDVQAEEDLATQALVGGVGHPFEGVADFVKLKDAKETKIPAGGYLYVESPMIGKALGIEEGQADAVVHDTVGDEALEYVKNTPIGTPIL